MERWVSVIRALSKHKSVQYERDYIHGVRDLWGRIRVSKLERNEA